MQSSFEAEKQFNAAVTTLEEAVFWEYVEYAATLPEEGREEVVLREAMQLAMKYRGGTSNEATNFVHMVRRNHALEVMSSPRRVCNRAEKLNEARARGVSPEDFRKNY